MTCFAFQANCCCCCCSSCLVFVFVRFENFTFFSKEFFLFLSFCVFPATEISFNWVFWVFPTFFVGLQNLFLFFFYNFYWCKTEKMKIWVDFLLGNEVWKCLCVLCVIIIPLGTLCRRVVLKNKKNIKNIKWKRETLLMRNGVKVWCDVMRRGYLG